MNSSQPLSEIHDVVRRKQPDEDATSLGSKAARDAIGDADIDPRLIEAAYCGHVFQGMATGQRILADIGLAGIPLANVENACSSGSKL